MANDKKYISPAGLRQVWGKINDVFAKKTDLPDVDQFMRKDEVPDLSGIVTDIDHATDNTLIAYDTDPDEIRVPSMGEFTALKEELDKVTADPVLIVDTTVSSDTSDYRINIEGYERIDVALKFASDRSANANLFIRFKEKNASNDTNLVTAWVNSNYTSIQIHVYRIGKVVYCDTATSTTDNNQSIRYAGFAITDKDISEFVLNYGSQKISAGSRIIAYGR